MLFRSINEGLHEGGFARSAAEAETVNAGTAEKQRREYMTGQEGRSASDRSRITAATRERAGHYVELRHLQAEATTQMISSGESEVPESMVNAVLTQGGAAFGQGSRLEQENRRLTSYNINSRLEQSTEGRAYQAEHGRLGGGSAEKDMADAANQLKRIADGFEKDRAAKETGEKKPGVPVALLAAGGGGKRQAAP